MLLPRRNVLLLAMAAAVSAILLALTLPGWLAARRFRTFSKMTLPAGSRIVSEDYQPGFTDDYYFAEVKLSPAGVAALLAERPAWAMTDWRRGEKSFWMRKEAVTGPQYVMIRESVDEVWRTVVVDTERWVLWFEYVSF